MCWSHRVCVCICIDWSCIQSHFLIPASPLHSVLHLLNINSDNRISLPIIMQFPPFWSESSGKKASVLTCMALDLTRLDQWEWNNDRHSYRKLELESQELWWRYSSSTPRNSAHSLYASGDRLATLSRSSQWGNNLKSSHQEQGSCSQYFLPVVVLARSPAPQHLNSDQGKNCSSHRSEALASLI